MRRASSIGLRLCRCALLDAHGHIARACNVAFVLLRSLSGSFSDTRQLRTVARQRRTRSINNDAIIIIGKVSQLAHISGPLRRVSIVFIEADVTQCLVAQSFGTSHMRLPSTQATENARSNNKLARTHASTNAIEPTPVPPAQDKPEKKGGERRSGSEERGRERGCVGQRVGN